MTAWILRPMDISKCWVSFLEMLCRSFRAAAFSCCLFVNLSALSSAFGNCEAYRSGFFQHVSGHDSCALQSVIWALLQHLSESEQKVLPCTENMIEFTLLHPSTVMSAIYSGDPVPLAVIHVTLTECVICIVCIGSTMSLSFSILSTSLVQGRYSWIMSFKKKNSFQNWVRKANSHPSSCS